MFFSKRFFPLFVTQFLGAFNDNFLKNAIVILIAFKGASLWGLTSAQIITLSGGIFIFPFFIFSALAGQLSDLRDKASIARWVKISEIGIMLIASVGFLSTHFELLLTSLFLMGVHSTFFGPMKYSILPQHLEEDELVAGNAYIESGTFLAILTGTLLGGILVSIPSYGTLALSVGLISIAVLGYLSARYIPAAPPVRTREKIDFNFFKSTALLIRYSKQTRSVWLSILGISWFWCFGASVLSLIPAVAKDIVGGNEGVVTTFLTTFSVGIGVGSLVCEKLSRHGIERGLVPLGAFGLTWGAFEVGHVLSMWSGTAASPMALFLHPLGMRLLAGFFIVAIFGGLYIVPLYALMQHDSEAGNRSRVIAGNNVINAIFMVAGALGLAALQGNGVSFKGLFWILGAVNFAVAVYIFFLIPEFFFRFLLWIASHVMYQVKIEGRENLPKVDSAVVVANHVTFIDWMFVSAAMPKPLRFIADANYCKGFVGWLMIRIGKVIPILTAKEDLTVLSRAFENIENELKDGSWVCIFPEGRLSWDGSLQVFKSGVTKIVEKTPVPVIPVGIEGLWGSWFSREGGKAILKAPKRFRAGIRIRIGKPVLPDQATPDELRRQVALLINR